MIKHKEPKILTLDIETSTMLVHAYELWDEHHSVDDIHADWELLSFAAKWLHRKEVMYVSLKTHTERQLCVLVSRAINSADIIVTQNGKKFDLPKINAKLLEHNLPPVKRSQNFDTLKEAKKLYKLPSYSLAYMSKKFNKTYQKLTHAEFPGKELGKECQKGNARAWKVMEKYNKWDVLATEELFLRIRPFSNVINWQVHSDTEKCFCGGSFSKNGWTYGSTGRYQRFVCKLCGAELRGQQLLGKAKLRKVS